MELVPVLLVNLIHTIPVLIELDMISFEKLLIIHRKDVVFERFRCLLEGLIISVVPIDFIVDEDCCQWVLLVNAAERVIY